MNAFLVMLRCAMDDFPVSLHATKTEADAAAMAVAADPWAVLDEMNNVFQIDASILNNVTIAEFSGGRVVSMEIIHSLDSIMEAEQGESRA